jgi:hypothetical protein
VNADSGQGQLFRSYLSGRTAVYAMAFGSALAFTLGAWRTDPLIMLGGPAAVVAAVVAIAWVAADRKAALNFYWGFANSVGLTYANSIELLPLTPLLGAGDRRHVDHWIYGRLPGELSGGIGQLVWERVERGSNGRKAVSDSNRFTICTVDLEASLPLFHGVFLHPRRGLFAPYPDWIGSAPTRTLEVESSRFGERYELRVATDQDEIMLRRLLSPTLVSWLANHPLAPGFELKAGTLCAFVPQAVEDAGNLTTMIDATTHLAGRVLAQVHEEQARVA